MKHTEDTRGISPSATVIPLRDGVDGLEILLLKRNPDSTTSAGAWVFPGGLIEREDYTDSMDTDPIAAARRAAVREAGEEAGLQLKAPELLPISRWTTPKNIFPKRFRTWFFLAKDPGQAVRIDNREILAHRWLSPEDALAARQQKEIELPPPTFVNLTLLSAYVDSATALDGMAGNTLAAFDPRFRKIEDGYCSLYAEDAAYDGDALDFPGPRHRLWLRDSGWCYEKKL